MGGWGGRVIGSDAYLPLHSISIMLSGTVVFTGLPVYSYLKLHTAPCPIQTQVLARSYLIFLYFQICPFYYGDCVLCFYLVLFLHFRRKTRLIKWASVCVSVYSFGPPPNNFHTSYAIDTKIWLHTVSYRNSPTPLIPFLNFENCAREKFF